MVPANSLSVDAIGLLRQNGMNRLARYHAIERSGPGASAAVRPARYPSAENVVRLVERETVVSDRFRDIGVTVRRQPRDLRREREDEF
jgi:hypothetical protein